MGFLNNLIVRIKGDNSDLKKSLDQSGTEVKTFADKVKGVGVAFGAAAAAAGFAFKAIIDWTKQQNFGIDSMNVGLSVTKQLFTDLITGQQVNLRQAIDIARKENDIRAGDRRDLVWEAKLRRDIRAARLGSVDEEKSLTERIKDATRALEKQQELEQYIKDDLKEELDVVEEKLKINRTDEALLMKRAQLQAAILNTDESESLRIITYRNSLLKEQKKRVDDLVDAFTELNQAQGSTPRTSAPGKVTNLPSVSGVQISGLPVAEGLQAGNTELKHQMTVMEQILTTGRDMAADLSMQIIESIGAAFAGGNVKEIGKELLLSLANFMSQFGKLLITLGLGLDAFVKSLKTMNPVIAIAAGIALIAAAGAIKGLMDKGVSPSGGGSGGSRGGGYSSSGAYAVAGGERLVAKLRGKDIEIALRRT
jgi:hypothetical protein